MIAVVPSARLHILIDYRPALRQRTGVGEYVHHLSAALVTHLAADDRVTLFSSSWKDRLAPEAVAGATAHDLRIPVTALNLLWHRLEWPPVERLGASPDVTWSLHPLRMPSRRAATVVTVHDLYFLDHPEATAREIRRDYPALARCHVRGADGVIVNSTYTARSVEDRLGVPAERITVCTPGAPAWGRRPEPPPGGPILHIGTIEPRKNTAALFEAYRRICATRPGAPPLVLAGRVESPELVPSGPSAGSIQLLGYVDPEQKLALLRRASVLVVPSWEEGFGIPALEAMTIGLPVVAANRGSLPEVLGDAGILVDPQDPVGFATGIMRLLDDEALRSAMAERGLARARDFSWTTSAARLLHGFRLALERRQARR